MSKSKELNLGEGLYRASQEAAAEINLSVGEMFRRAGIYLQRAADEPGPCVEFWSPESN